MTGPATPPRTAEEVGGGLAAGDRRCLARVLTWIEAGDPRAVRALGMVRAAGPQSYVVGLTGAPGAGKSSLTSALVELLRSAGETVGVLAVDPSSPFTGGALLGDRIRMAAHTRDPGVFVRSMATRGQLGGLTAAVPAALRAMAAYGVDWVLVETVGVGQVEVDVASHADTTVVVVAPGWGDDVQAGKAGVLEVADVLVVNKGDLPGAEAAAQQLVAASALGPPSASRPVLRCVATTGQGVPEVLGALRTHRRQVEADAGLSSRRQVRDGEQAVRAVLEQATGRLERLLRETAGQALIEDLLCGRVDLAGAAATVLRQAGGPG